MRKLRTLASWKTAVAITLAALVATPGVAIAAHFTDTASSVHKDNIDWMETTGITVGCTTTEYCPEEPVTRAQMATFMRRLAGQAEGVAPVVNAGQLDGLDSTAFLGATAKAADADQVDGLDSADLLGGTLPSGITQKGVWTATIALTDSYWYTESWNGIVSGELTVHYIDDDDAIPTGCSGDVEDPGAAAGYLCVFEAAGTSPGLDDFCVWRPQLDTGLCGDGTYPFGFGLYLEGNSGEAWGSWAMTTP